MRQTDEQSRLSKLSLLKSMHGQLQLLLGLETRKLVRHTCIKQVMFVQEYRSMHTNKIAHRKHRIGLSSVILSEVYLQTIIGLCKCKHGIYVEDA